MTLSIQRLGYILYVFVILDIYIYIQTCLVGRPRSSVGSCGRCRRPFHLHRNPPPILEAVLVRCCPSPADGACSIIIIGQYMYIYIYIYISSGAIQTSMAWGLKRTTPVVESGSAYTYAIYIYIYNNYKGGQLTPLIMFI